MLPKERRIPRRLWKPLLESKNYFHSPHFLLKTAASENVRISVSVSKKVAKLASARNTLRRRAYAALRPLIPLLPSKLYLFSAKPGAFHLAGEKLSAELAALLKKS